MIRNSAQSLLQGDGEDNIEEAIPVPSEGDESVNTIPVLDDADVQERELVD